VAIRQVEEAAGADFIPLTIDSYTRHNQYDTAEDSEQMYERLLSDINIME
jgi:glutamate mutase epsilon subunit